MRTDLKGGGLDMLGDGIYFQKSLRVYKCKASDNFISALASQHSCTEIQRKTRFVGFHSMGLKWVSICHFCNLNLDLWLDLEIIL